MNILNSIIRTTKPTPRPPESYQNEEAMQPSSEEEEVLMQSGSGTEDEQMNEVTGREWGSEEENLDESRIKKSEIYKFDRNEFLLTLDRELGIESQSFGIDLAHRYEDDDDRKIEAEYLKLPNRDECQYTNCFCEENVWMLCEYVRKYQPGMLNYIFVVFFSNEAKMIPMWEQNNGKGQDRLVYWDYHVVLVFKKEAKCAVYDLDSCLPFPSDFRMYVMQALKPDLEMPKQNRRKMRVIRANEFLHNFSSDRSHMMKEDGTWIEEPPPYSPICPTGCNNLASYISMEEESGPGILMKTKEFIQYFMPPDVTQKSVKKIIT